MMQPLDIRSTNFGKGLFGYKKTDVDSYVDTVYRAYDELFTENKKLREEKDAIARSLEEERVKIFELEKNQGGSSADSEREEILAKARKEAAEIIAKAKKEAGVADTAEEPKKEEKSAASKFFEQSEDTVIGGDGDDVFVGEIEDNNRKPSKVMIGDGEEEGADDFEFL